VGDPAEGTGLTAGGVADGDPAGVGELVGVGELDGVAERLGVREGLEDKAGLGSYRAELDGAGFTPCWAAPAASGTGRTRM
jgi:hypothetical protein